MTGYIKLSALAEVEVKLRWLARHQLSCHCPTRLRCRRPRQTNREASLGAPPARLGLPWPSVF